MVYDHFNGISDQNVVLQGLRHTVHLEHLCIKNGTILQLRENHTAI